MPCNSRKDLVSDNSKYSMGLASEMWEKAPPCMVSMKSTEQSDIGRTTVTYVYKILPLLAYICIPKHSSPFSSGKPVAELGLFPGAHRDEAELLTETLHSGLLGHRSILNPFIITEPNPML